jgi:hypothetical protein
MPPNAVSADAQTRESVAYRFGRITRGEDDGAFDLSPLQDFPAGTPLFILERHIFRYSTKKQFKAIAPEIFTAST